VFDQALTAFADLLSRGATLEGFAAARLARALAARAMKDLTRVYKRLM
jgi:hypothetical protein